MQFFATNGTRPVRLNEQTRRFAFESLEHVYGLDTAATPSVALDDIPDFESLSPLAQYDAAIERIATTAPLRICDGEKISGAATLGLAVHHRVPATYRGESPFDSVSHLTIDFETVLKHGVDGIQAQAEDALARHRGTDREAFINSCLHCLRCLRVWHARYVAELSSRTGYEQTVRRLQTVPFRPATNFHEAVQSLWFVFAFVRLCGNWPGIGRLDLLLGDYLRNDLENGTLTLADAREILAHLFIKGCEWVKGGDYGSGDAQHYQNIILGGVDEHGNDVTNTVTYLVLDILEELGISDFPTTVRVNRNTDPALLHRAAEVIRLGGGVLAVYNEDLVIESLVGDGYSLAEARTFANDGCWEVQIPGKTAFSYIPFDALQLLQQTTLDGYSGRVNFDDFDAVYAAFIADLKRKVADLIARRNADTFVSTDGAPDKWVWRNDRPCTVVSLFEQGWLENGRSYTEGGAVYNVVSPHIGGLPDVVNSLYAIKKLVFDDRLVSFADLMHLLKTDWNENEALRQYVLNSYAYFGNDNDEVDKLAARIIDEFANACDAESRRGRLKTPAGISTFGRQLEWSELRRATSYGKKAHAVLAGNFSPAPGTDKGGATAVIKSYCKANLKRTVSGAALDIKLLPSSVSGENGVDAIAALIRGFVALGGHFMQLDIADASLLKAAQAHPEDYQQLSVRVSGWNARFVTLSREWQDMIIEQTGSTL
ncbi:MAG: hypothetical protein IKV35_01630 [Clostridia bacterium]|nr:hypothetical protein [Clostridia bacterium]